MVKETLNTEERILECAKSIFHTKGFEGARMHEIADAAGVNKALVHYYYRNKDTLFNAVFEDAFLKLISRVNEIFVSDIPFDLKVASFVDYYIDFLSRNSYLPIFILHCLYTRPEQLKKLLEKVKISPMKMMSSFGTKLNTELNLTIDPLQLYMNILSLCIFPVLARPLIEQIFGLTTEQSDQFYLQRKAMVPEFILNALQGYENKTVNNG